MTPLELVVVFLVYGAACAAAGVDTGRRRERARNVDAHRRLARETRERHPEMFDQRGVTRATQTPALTAQLARRSAARARHKDGTS